MDIYYWTISELKMALDEWYLEDFWELPYPSIAEECMAVLIAEIQLRRCWAE